MSETKHRLPDELDDPDVVDYSSRHERKYDCWHVVLDRQETGIQYREQWKNSWEILFAMVETESDEPRLRLVFIERKSGLERLLRDARP